MADNTSNPEVEGKQDLSISVPSRKFTQLGDSAVVLITGYRRIAQIDSANKVKLSFDALTVVKKHEAKVCSSARLSDVLPTISQELRHKFVAIADMTTFEQIPNGGRFLRVVLMRYHNGKFEDAGIELIRRGTQAEDTEVNFGELSGFDPSICKPYVLGQTDVIFDIADKCKVDIKPWTIDQLLFSGLAKDRTCKYAIARSARLMILTSKHIREFLPQGSVGTRVDVALLSPERGFLPVFTDREAGDLICESAEWSVDLKKQLLKTKGAAPK
jgi:hypothetical protein